jgi:hypothetical protein
VNWEWVALEQVLQLATTSIPIVESRSYLQVTVHPYPRGMVFKAQRSGLDFPKKQQLCFRAGQFVISKFRLRKSIWGLVPPDLDGAVAPHNYHAFNLAPKLDAGYLAAFLSTARFRRAAIAACSPKGRLVLAEFGAITLPLPDLDTQRQVAELYQQAQSALIYTAEMLTDIHAIKAGVAANLLSKINPSWERTTLGRLAVIGRDVWDEHLLSVAAPEQIKFGTGDNGAVRIVPTLELDVQFLYYVLEIQQPSLRAALNGTSATLEDVLAGFPIHLPTLYEQRKIAAMLQEHDEVLLRLRLEQAALRKLVNGTIQLIFSGTLNLREAISMLQNFL